jgi:hypothetical protein
MFPASLLLLLFRDVPDMTAVAGVPFLAQIRAVATSLLLLLDLPSLEVEGGWKRMVGYVIIIIIIIMFMYRRPTLYPLEIVVDFLKSL